MTWGMPEVAGCVCCSQTYVCGAHADSCDAEHKLPRLCCDCAELPRGTLLLLKSLGELRLSIEQADRRLPHWLAAAAVAGQLAAHADPLPSPDGRTAWALQLAESVAELVAARHPSRHDPPGFDDD